jgi:hypothetical protein
MKTVQLLPVKTLRVGIQVCLGQLPVSGVSLEKIFAQQEKHNFL